MKVTTPKPHTTAHNPGLRPQDWNAAYWDAEHHGSAWERIKEALRRDWEQTKVDIGAEGGNLNQGVGNTVRQAAGSEAIPPRSQPVNRRAWSDAEPAVRYGVGAYAQYGSRYGKWNDEVEVKLSTEWDEEKTGRPFSEVRKDVQRGWSAKP
jgi:hypothetical protein